MQILQGKNTRTDLPMPTAARIQLDIQPEVVSNSDKHAAVPTYNLHVGKHVMFQDSTSMH